MELNRYIDHTNLRPDALADDIGRLCREAVEHRFCSVVVNPAFVGYAADTLKGSGVRICTVAGFPLGATFVETKTDEAVRAEELGADEIDVVANIGRLQGGEFPDVRRELAEIRRRLSGRTVMKVIIETPLLSPERWPGAVETVIDAGAQFIKTGTGFFGAVTARHVLQLKELCGDRIKIKAAGGIRTAPDASALILAGADRLGSSASVGIMHSLRNTDL